MTKKGEIARLTFRLDGHFKAELSQLFLKQLSMLSVGDRQQRKAVFVGFTRPVESLLSPQQAHSSNRSNHMTELIALIVVEQDFPTPGVGQAEVGQGWGPGSTGPTLKDPCPKYTGRSCFAAKDSPPPIHHNFSKLIARFQPCIGL